MFAWYILIYWLALWPVWLPGDVVLESFNFSCQSKFKPDMPICKGYHLWCSKTSRHDSASSRNIASGITLETTAICCPRDPLGFAVWFLIGSVCQCQCQCECVCVWVCVSVCVCACECACPCARTQYTSWSAASLCLFSMCCLSCGSVWKVAITKAKKQGLLKVTWF